MSSDENWRAVVKRNPTRDTNLRELSEGGGGGGGVNPLDHGRYWRSWEQNRCVGKYIFQCIIDEECLRGGRGYLKYGIICFGRNWRCGVVGISQPKR